MSKLNKLIEGVRGVRSLCLWFYGLKFDFDCDIQFEYGGEKGGLVVVVERSIADRD